MTSNKQIYTAYLADLQKQIISAYESSGRRASGKFADKIEPEATETRMALYGAEHSVFVEKGRKPGNFPPRRSIENWIEVKKGLPSIFREKKKQFAFLIARKIAEKGTQGSDVLESVLQSWIENTMPKMLKEIGDAYVVQIENDVVSLLRNMTK